MLANEIFLENFGFRDWWTEKWNAASNWLSGSSSDNQSTQQGDGTQTTTPVDNRISLSSPVTRHSQGYPGQGSPLLNAGLTVTVPSRK